MLSNKSEINFLNKKIKIISISSTITIMVIIVIIMLNNNGISKEQYNRRLLALSTANTSLSSSNIDIINIPILIDVNGSKSISCYTNESYLSYQYGSNTLNVSCTTSGYQLTGCSSIVDYYSYGVYSDGNYCYGDRFVHGPSEFPNMFYLQARCCKGMKDTLNVEYKKKLNSDIIKNSCNELKCTNSNQTAMGTSIMLGYNNNSYSQNEQQNRGVMYVDTSLSSLIYANTGNITTSNYGLFCGNTKNNNLKCTSVYGNFATGTMSYSSVNCTSGYKLTACDIQSSYFSCSNSNNYLETSGTYIDDNTCISYGFNQRPVARCCTIA